MGFIQDYAQEVFREVNKHRGKNIHDKFIKEYQKLLDEKIKEENKNDVGCIISSNCSLRGCYRYSICDFEEKK